MGRRARKGREDKVRLRCVVRFTCMVTPHVLMPAGFSKHDPHLELFSSALARRLSRRSAQLRQARL